MSGLVFHAPLISSNPGFRLHKIVERSTDKSRERFPQATIVRSFDELLADDSLELIVVNTPNVLHRDMGRRALEAGKHVILEKPMTVTTSEGQELIDLARSRNLVLSVFQNRRWDGDFRTVQQVLQSQVLGHVVDLEAHFDRFRNYIEANTWKEESGPGSGLLYNLGSHMIDQALVLFGKPDAVTGETGIQRPGGQVDDYYHLTLHYPNRRVVLKSSYLVRETGPRFLLHGTQGSFIKSGLDPQEAALKAGLAPGSADWGVEESDTWGNAAGRLPFLLPEYLRSHPGGPGAGREAGGIVAGFAHHRSRHPKQRRATHHPAGLAAGEKQRNLKKAPGDTRLPLLCAGPQQPCSPPNSGYLLCRKFERSANLWLVLPPVCNWQVAPRNPLI
jgi:scyllo-inositol 2-dehydrogenase (NADP+)